MATIIMTFPNPLNVSLQLVDSTTTGSWANNDICYYQANGTTTVTRIGPCIALAGTTVTCDIDVTTPLPSIGDFVFFAKFNKVISFCHGAVSINNLDDYANLLKPRSFDNFNGSLCVSFSFFE